MQSVDVHILKEGVDVQDRVDDCLVEDTTLKGIQTESINIQSLKWVLAKVIYHKSPLKKPPFLSNIRGPIKIGWSVIKANLQLSGFEFHGIIGCN